MKKILILLFTFNSFFSLAQGILDQKVNGADKNKTLLDFLEETEKRYPVKFYFLSNWFDRISFEKSYNGQTLRYTLNEILSGTELNYIEFSANIIVFVKDPNQAIQRNTIINTAIQERKKVEKIQFGDPQNFTRNQQITISGLVKRNKNDEFLPGASIRVKNLGIGGITDERGMYKLNLPAGEHVISFSSINFEEKVFTIEGYANGELNVVLEEIPILLDEVVIHDRTKEVVTSSVGLVQLSIKELKRAPSLMGEPDLIKQIQVLPGVTTVGEAASGYNVRGGSVDQNLILYDGMPVFNSAHVFGFFSTFNSEAVKSASFYRGGIPAEFGGRVSSVLDIQSKEGDFEKWGGGAGIGMITSNVNIGGPIVKDKTSIFASMRSTYSDWLINSIRTNYADLSKSSVTFYDASLKLTHKFSQNTKVTLSGYLSRDQFHLKGDSSYSWNNSLASFRLDHVFSPRLNLSVLAGYGSYDYKVVDKNSDTGFNLFYKISYPSVKADFIYQTDKHKISFGGQGTYYGFEPGTFKPLNPNAGLDYVEIEKQQSVEGAIFVSDNFSINEKLNIEGGLRLSVFRSLGPGTVNTYKPGLPIEVSNFDSTLTFKKGENIKTYHGLEPRISLRYSLTANSSIKVGYNRIYQYLHLVTNTTAVTPIDIWQPSGSYFKPQMADQFSLGYFRNLRKGKFDFFVESYYKSIANILDFKDGANLILNKHIETDLLQGKGTAYGVETQLAKVAGRLVGSVSYAYSRSLRTIAGPTSDQSINNGKTYPSNFDQPHAVNLSWKYAISRRYFFTGGFTYRTGRPITLPLSGYTIDNLYVTNFSERNAYRIQDYHRLDLAIVLEGDSFKRKRNWQGTWTFSIYNVYGRRNPYTVFFKGAAGSTLIPYQLSILGSVLPSLSYSVKF